MHQTLGSHSPIAAAARALLTKRGRREQGAYAVEGTTLLEEALAAGAALRSIFGTATALAAAQGTIERAGCPVYEITEAMLAKLSDLSSPPGILAIVERRETGPARMLDGSPAVLVAGVSDPGNAGTILRTAEIFGITRALFTPLAVEPWNPKLVRSAMGAIFRMQICVAKGESILEAARAGGYRVVATGTGGRPLPAYRFVPRSLIAIGNERRGVGDGLESWDDLVSIPQRGAGESLNAAVAAGLVLYAFSLVNGDGLSSLGGPKPPCYTSPET